MLQDANRGKAHALSLKSTGWKYYGSTTIHRWLATGKDIEHRNYDLGILYRISSNKTQQNM